MRKLFLHLTMSLNKNGWISLLSHIQPLLHLPPTPNTYLYLHKGQGRSIYSQQRFRTQRPLLYILIMLHVSLLTLLVIY